MNESVKISNSSEDRGSEHYYHRSSVAYKGGKITSHGNMQGIVEGDFRLVGSRMKSDGDMRVKVGGDSYIASQLAHELEESQSSYTSSGYFSDKTHERSESSLRESLAKAEISAGGSSGIAVLSAGGNIENITEFDSIVFFFKYAVST